MRSLHKPGALGNLVDMLGKYKIQIAALQEVCWLGDGHLSSGSYTVFYSCHETLHRLGVSFAVSQDVLSKVVDFRAVNERICVLRVRGKWFNMSLINIHAPHEGREDEVKDEFYDTLDDVFDRCPRQDIKIVLGDCNAMIGREEVLFPVIGRHSLHLVSNDNGLRLVSFATSKDMTVVSTRFPHRDIHKGTWKSNDRQTVNQIDHVLIDCRHARIVQDVRVQRGADTDSDHLLVLCRIAMRVSRTVEGQPCRVRRFDTQKFESEETKTRFQIELRNRFSSLDMDTANIDECWVGMRNATEAAAKATIGYRKRRKAKAWFDEDCKVAVEERGEARLLAIQNTDNVAYQVRYEQVKRSTRNLLTAKKRRSKISLVEDLERVSHANNKHQFFRRLENLRKGFQPKKGIIRSREGILLADPHQILERWKEYFEDLLNVPLPADPLPPSQPLDGWAEDPPISLGEVEEAVRRLKLGRACGVDEIPAELWKHGGDVVIEALYNLITKIWEAEDLPDQWREALIVPIFKKGDRKECGNYRGISLLCTAYKVLSYILLQRLSPLAEEVLGEYQCGFRPGRSPIDQIFILRQILEKKREYNSEVHNLFMDFKKAYDSIHREGLFNIMTEFGFSRKLVKMTSVCLRGVRSRILAEGQVSDAFDVNTGLRQGDGLSPLLFNLVLEKVVRALENVRGGVDLGGIIKNQGYADDINLLGETREDVRRLCGELLIMARRVGLEVNEDKTEYLVMSRNRVDEGPLEVDGMRFRNVTEFRYLGSTVTSDNDINYEVAARIQSANRCLFSLNDILRSRHLSRRAKLLAYNTVIRPIVTYGCETWALTLEAQRRLLVFENKVLRKILGPYTDPLTGRRKLRPNVETRRLTGQPWITSVIKSRRLQWAGHVARAPRTRVIRQVLEGRPNSPRPPGRPRKRWKDNVDDDAEALLVPMWQIACQNRTEWRGVCDAAMRLQAL